MTIFRDFAREIFGVADVPETIPLRILGLRPPVPNREAIVSAFRRRVIEVHPDLQLAYDHPVLQGGAEAVEDRPEIRELVWARDVLVEIAPNGDSVTDSGGGIEAPTQAVTRPWVCRDCQQERHRWSGGRCLECSTAHEAAQARERRRRRRANRRCAGCAAIFTPSRADGRYCSPACRQRAYRQRTTGNGPSVARERSSARDAPSSAPRSDQ